MGIVIAGNFYVVNPQGVALIDPTNSHHLQLPKFGSHARPYYYAIECTWDGSYMWFVPITHQIDKYKKFLSVKKDLFYDGNFLGQERIFLIQNMIPIKRGQVERPFTKNNVAVKLATKYAREVGKRVRRVEHLFKNHVVIYRNCPDWYDFVTQSRRFIL
ncbi:hypothetical protein [Lacticaseibacillus paracasei]|uniref:hypothetical protein n=1 Tax=Lacticaseibacillus paracasei TaxID=1597 RepID=UPI00202EC1CB|nr:hypothetical protein [Lacticaseibacillus paracasei]URW90418.1 hypothetical protein NCY29_09640 [Lacticaseibacillus paracasei]